MTHAISRRRALTGLAAAAAVLLSGTISAVAVETPIAIDWSDLIPERDGAARAMEQLGIVQHGEIPMSSADQSDAPVTTEYNGKRVRIPGYVVPLDYSGTGVREFILVPYVGACIHVPPPPPNQIVFVTTEKPFEIEGLFAPVYVTGTFSTLGVQTELADVGYSLSADTIEPYE